VRIGKENSRNRQKKGQENKFKRGTLETCPERPLVEGEATAEASAKIKESKGERNYLGEVLF